MNLQILEFVSSFRNPGTGMNKKSDLLSSRTMQKLFLPTLLEEKILRIHAFGARIRNVFFFFFVKSAYHLAFNIKPAASTTSSDGSHVKRFWKIKAAPKEKICAWKSILNIIPSQVNIFNKGIDTNHLYFLCRKKAEFVEHVIWTCVIAKKVWCHFFPILLSVSDFFREGWDAMERWARLQELSKDHEATFAINIVGSIWNFRNQVKIKAETPDPTKIIREVNSKTREGE